MAAPVCVARIGAAHGVRGAVKLWTFTEDPYAVKEYGPLTTRDGARQFEVTHVREAKDHLVATLKSLVVQNPGKPFAIIVMENDTDGLAGARAARAFTEAGSTSTTRRFLRPSRAGLFCSHQSPAWRPW